MGVKISKEKTIKEKNPNSGRSCSSEFPNGKRRTVGGKELAPRSLRKQGHKFLTDCSSDELIKLGFN